MFAWRSFSVWALPLGLGTLFACGPFFPENALDKPKGILQPPMFHYLGELYKLENPWLGEVLAGRKAGSPAITLDLEMAEMEEVMAGRLSVEAERRAWLADYQEMRRAMIGRGDVSAYALQHEDRQAAKPVSAVQADSPRILERLPKDIRLYLEGAFHHLQGMDDVANAESHRLKAREAWKQVLALPVEERTWRSTWAAWMLFRTCSPEEKRERGRWLAETRRLSEEGLADCLHLGIEATYILGRLASDLPERKAVSAAQWKKAAYQRALLGHSRAEEQLSRFDRWEQGKWSKELAAQTLADPLLRQGQMLHLIETAQDALGWDFGHHQKESEQTDLELKNWLASFEKSDLRDQKEATLLAWLYYNAARFDEARRWLKLAPQSDVVTLSLKGKLAAMDGKKAETVKALKAVAAQMPGSQDAARSHAELESDFTVLPLSVTEHEQARRHHFLADFGRAQLAVNDFTGALQTFSQTDFWDDTAYIAEKLISVDELLAMQRAGKMGKRVFPKLDRAEPKPPARRLSELNEKYGGWGGPAGEPMMQYLVARRLARQQYFKNAQQMLPPDLAAGLKLYADAFRKGHDRKLPKAKRAESLWQAAQIHRLLGFEFFGYETGPDYFAVGGSFQLRDLTKFRNQKVWTDAWIYDNRALIENQQTPTFPATADEIWRARHYGTKVDKRFHYRYTAADLAWEAAALMPDDEPLTAEVLCIAGSWLMRKDPQTADRFYKAMVRRNPNVPLAQEADKKHWFPEVTWAFDLELPGS